MIETEKECEEFNPQTCLVLTHNICFTSKSNNKKQQRQQQQHTSKKQSKKEEAKAGPSPPVNNKKEVCWECCCVGRPQFQSKGPKNEAKRKRGEEEFSQVPAGGRNMGNGPH